MIDKTGIHALDVQVAGAHYKDLPIQPGFGNKNINGNDKNKCFYFKHSLLSYFSL